MLAMLVFMCAMMIAYTSSNTPDYKYQRVREILIDAIRPKGTARTQLFDKIAEKRKLQLPHGPEEPFPCSTAGQRSSSRPSSVHRLRPGDIDVVAAMGDSLTAANGNAALTLLHLFVENRGVSWSIGGEGTWRKFLTLPNILKEFNGALRGFPEDDALSSQRASRFNVAEGGAMSRDLPFQAGLLVRRMHDDVNVDIANDWKLITILIGANDFCFDICYTDSAALPQRHRADLMETLDYLQRHLPRTLVNLVITPNLATLLEPHVRRPNECHFLNLFECPCLFGRPNEHRKEEFLAVLRKWQHVEEEVAISARYAQTEDFAVVWQPFAKDVTILDTTLLSYDCFHLSQKGSATAAVALWNNMLEPVANKSTTWKDISSHLSLLCPSEERPYIYTGKNSPSGERPYTATTQDSPSVTRS